LPGINANLRDRKQIELAAAVLVHHPVEFLMAFHIDTKLATYVKAKNKYVSGCKAPSKTKLSCPAENGLISNSHFSWFRYIFLYLSLSVYHGFGDNL
jgi:hypothetical protein